MAFPSVEWEEIRARFTDDDTCSTAMKCQVTTTRAEVIQAAEFEGLKQVQERCIHKEDRNRGKQMGKEEWSTTEGQVRRDATAETIEGLEKARKGLS